MRPVSQLVQNPGSDSGQNQGLCFPFHLAVCWSLSHWWGYRQSARIEKKIAKKCISQPGKVSKIPIHLKWFPWKSQGRGLSDLLAFSEQNLLGALIAYTIQIISITFISLIVLLIYFKVLLKHYSVIFPIGFNWSWRARSCWFTKAVTLQKFFQVCKILSGCKYHQQYLSYWKKFLTCNSWHCFLPDILR